MLCSRLSLDVYGVVFALVRFGACLLFTIPPVVSEGSLGIFCCVPFVVCGLAFVSSLFSPCLSLSAGAVCASRVAGGAGTMIIERLRALALSAVLAAGLRRRSAAMAVWAEDDRPRRCGALLACAGRRQLRAWASAPRSVAAMSGRVALRRTVCCCFDPTAVVPGFCFGWSVAPRLVFGPLSTLVPHIGILCRSACSTFCPRLLCLLWLLGAFVVFLAFASFVSGGQRSVSSVVSPFLLSPLCPFCRLFLCKPFVGPGSSAEAWHGALGWRALFCVSSPKRSS